MHKTTISLICLILLCLLTSTQSFADVWGSAWIDYDVDAGLVVASCETDTDMTTGQYYNASVDCVIRDGDGYAVAWGSNTTYTWGMAIVDLQAQAVGDELYIVESDNSVELSYWAQNKFWDPFNYYYWTFQSVYAHSFFDYLAGSPEQFPLDSPIQTGTTYDQVQTPACPSSVTLANLWPYDLANYYTQYVTGMGAVGEMRVGPASTDWRKALISEAVSLSSKTCPESFNWNFCAGSSTWNPQRAETFFGIPWGPTANTFYDGHFTWHPTDNVLVRTNTPSCEVYCNQTYSCGGNVIGRFKISRYFTLRTIQGNNYSNVRVEKQAVP